MSGTRCTSTPCSLQVGDCGIDVVDSDREVVRTERLGIGLHQVHLLAAGVEPVPRAEIGARQLRHAENVTIEGETLLRVGDADGDMVYTGRLHRSILTRSHMAIPPFRLRWLAIDRHVITATVVVVDFPVSQGLKDSVTVTQHQTVSLGQFESPAQLLVIGELDRGTG